MKKIILILMFSILAVSCKKEKNTVVQSLPESQEEIIEIEENKRINIATIGDDIDVWYETDDSVVYAKKSTKEQFVIVCDNADYYHTQKHLIGQIKYLLENRSKSLENTINFTEVHVLPTVRDRAYKTEEVNDEYYETTVLRYYVTYYDVYHDFNA